MGNGSCVLQVLLHAREMKLETADEISWCSVAADGQSQDGFVAPGIGRRKQQPCSSGKSEQRCG